PPHIHNVTYRAVVIKGLVHNDDQNATEMWMPSGSFWTQPLGESHITSAKGNEVIAYVEIDSGPYLVKATDEAFDNGERPINIDASNAIWLNSDETNWIDSESEAEISFLWESKSNDRLRGLFIKLPVQFRGEIHSDADVFHSIVIQGNPTYLLYTESKTLDPTSYFGSEGMAIHQISNEDSLEVLLYVRTNEKLQIINTKDLRNNQ
ncbi:MAG: DUF4437 domain-containing protein, partial [Bacteroidia bacterium]|nr:DUF4437 domain-containing protein [Bacteroidia bacterium]